MPNKHTTAIGIAVCLFITGCNKRQVPEHTTAITTTNRTASKTITSSSTNNSSTTPVKRVMVRRTTASSVPRVILVNDKAAKKSFDGRLYYDINGRRYWRNYDDGKYYIFDKSMYSNKAFRPH